jgi:hypothetical protein
VGESTAAEIVRKTTGMWWPDADSGKLREAASAWKTMATALDDVAAAANNSARSVLEGNHGKAIDAFQAFWNRYDDGGKGWLPETAHACRQMAKALDDFADEVDKAIHKLEEEAAIVGATLVVGTALAIFTAGISEAVAGAATAGIIAAADALGVAVSETVASIAATTLTGAAFGVVESVAVDAAVAQPVRIAFGDGGFSFTELLTAAEIGGVGGAAGGGLSRGARALSQVADGAEIVSMTLAGIGKVAAGMDTMPGRMVIGGAMGAGQDALFNDGHISPLDVATGAIGGAAAGRSTKNHSGEDVGVGKRAWPTDPSTGSPLTDHDLEFLGLTHEQIEWWRNGDAPLGMTPQTYHEWSTSMHGALREDGIPPETVDVRLLGSAARGFSGPHKQIPTEQQITEGFPQDVAHTAIERRSGWLGDAPERLKGRPFDSLNKLGLDEPSDYDTNISNDLMVEKARAWWEAKGDREIFSVETMST